MTRQTASNTRAAAVFAAVAFAFYPASKASAQDSPIRDTSPAPVIQETSPAPVIHETSPEPVVHETSPEPVESTSPVDSLSRLQRQPVTVVGCIVKERDYRRLHRAGKGGWLATGAGLGNEYVLVNAVQITPEMPAPKHNVCSPQKWGDAYEMTGWGEGQLRAFVRQPVEITGILKSARISRATRGTANPKPSGGFDPLNQDLRIFEINVQTAKAYTPPPQVARVVVPVIIMPRQAPAPETPVAKETPHEQETPAGTAGHEKYEKKHLPKTASPLPLVALLGAFFVAMAISLRVVRGMTASVRS